MKRKILALATIMAMTFLYWGCDSSSKKKEEEVIPVITKIVLLEDKNSIPANGSEEVNLSVTVYDQSNNIMNGESYTIYNGESIFEGTKFATTTPGAYIFKAKSGSIVSNEIKITAVDVSPKATTIEFKSDLTTILANGTDKVTFTVEVFDQYGDLYTAEPATIVYGKEEESNIKTSVRHAEVVITEGLTGNTFATKVPGHYGFIAKCGKIQSQEIEIIVPELITVTNFAKSKDYSDVLGLEVYNIAFEVTSTSITKLVFTESTNTSPYEVSVSDKKAVIEKLMVDSSLKTITVSGYDTRNRVIGNPITVKLKD
jgi:hypothetical protein